MFSNIYQPRTYWKLRDIIWVRCTFLHESGEVQFVMFYWLYKARIGRRSYSSTTRVIYWSSIHSNKRYCHLLGLDKISSVAYDSGETQTCNSSQKYWSKIPTDMNVLIWAKSIKHFNTIPPATSAKYLAACTRMCRKGRRCLFWK